MRVSRSLLALLAVAGLSVSITACGGDSESPLATTDDASNDTADTVADEATDDTAPLDDSTSDDGAAGDGEPDDLCLGSAFLSAGMASSFGGGESPEDIEQYFDEVADNVPAEIKDDFEVVADFMGDYTAFLAKYDNDMTKAMSDPDALAELESLYNEDIEEASQNIETWTTENC